MGRGIKEANWKHWHWAEVSLGIKRPANKEFPQYSHLMRWRGPEFTFLYSLVWLSSGCHSTGKRSPFLRFYLTHGHPLSFSCFLPSIFGFTYLANKAQHSYFADKLIIYRGTLRRKDKPPWAHLTQINSSSWWASVQPWIFDVKFCSHIII